ncbi:MAG: Txe/YoeB family addiction module toxin [Propionibacteriaceae bacterium]|nr:Txe/YoeB family addiction module toxin [Propionibacteriaceae bacterium]
MRLGWTDDGWDDYLWWQAQDRKTVAKINRLITEARRTPTEGTGKPEQLRYSADGAWSRRITGEHRLVYRIEGDFLVIAQCRFHYDRR